MSIKVFSPSIQSVMSQYLRKAPLPLYSHYESNGMSIHESGIHNGAPQSLVIAIGTGLIGHQIIDCLGGPLLVFLKKQDYDGGVPRLFGLCKASSRLLSEVYVDLLQIVGH